MFVLFALFCCKNDEKQKPVLPDGDSIKIEKTKNSTLENTTEIIPASRFPFWLEELHTPNTKNVISNQIREYVQITDNLSSCIISYNDGVCLKSVLLTYLSKQAVDEVSLEENCDHDQSLANYSWSEYRKSNERTFWSTNYHIILPDSLKNSEGRSIEGIDIDTFAETKKGITMRFEIQDSGKILTAIID